MIHSTTIVLPLWFCILEKLELEARKMPRDVATRWNSTFDMLEFALQYRTAIDEIAGNKTANLRQYELNDQEWRIAEQLHDILKVCCLFEFRFRRRPKLTVNSRSSRTLLSTSRAQRLTSRQSSRLWTISTRLLHPNQLILTTNPLFARDSAWPR
jgi:hypothetical protein